MEGGVRYASDEQKSYLFAKQGGLCAACHKQLSVSDPADHIVLFAIGGNTCLSNLQLLCLRCHAEKTRVDFRLARASRD
ncbi:MAG: HNH endonuclease [Caulobacteraceae bacterium]|nr:HNH endonuclease [Caulobacteraceae bacterium]